jgi:hypothetical protein
MLRAARRLLAWMNRSPMAADEVQLRHLAWDRDCRARGMTAREQAQGLQLRCAWVRLRTKASAAVLRKPARFREILDRVAADEAKTLAAVGGDAPAAVFLRACAAAEPLEILSAEAAALVRARVRSKVASLQAAPPLAPDLPAARTRQKAR